MNIWEIMISVIYGAVILLSLYTIWAYFILRNHKREKNSPKRYHEKSAPPRKGKSAVALRRLGKI